MYVTKRIVPALAAVVNMCLSSGLFPDKLKITRTETLFYSSIGKHWCTQKLQTEFTYPDGSKTVWSCNKSATQAILKLIFYFQILSIGAEQKIYRRLPSWLKDINKLFEMGKSIAPDLADGSLRIYITKDFVSKFEAYKVRYQVLPVFCSYLAGKNQVLSIRNSNP